MTAFPIPDAALDDRLGFVGTAGSGKTYNAGAAVERLLDLGARVVIVDPLDVWWGLRLSADGKKPAFALPIFGGAHGDLPLNERAGKLIGETVAGMGESCIVSLGEMPTKEAERRFMLDFLETLYRKSAGSPFHVIFDEADLWAPQGAGSGSGPLLQALMEQIVRRGRVKGFIPWLITQRPAVISKDVLSQVDGLVAFKLTSSHDRKAIGEWVKGQSDLDEWSRIWASFPTMQQGQGVVWVPARGILETAQFPLKRTYDSSRSPKRGEKREHRDLVPLDLVKLKDRLGAIEEETKANDPAALKAEVTRLKRELARAEKVKAAPPQVVHANAEDLAKARAEAEAVGVWRGIEMAQSALKALAKGGVGVSVVKPAPQPKRSNDTTMPAPVSPARVATLAPPPMAGGDADLTGPQKQVLSALAWWSHMGNEQPTRAQVCAILGWKITSGHIKNVAGSLRSLGLVDFPAGGRLGMTEAGRAAAPEPDTSLSFHDQLRSTLSGPQRMVFDHLLSVGVEQTRAEVCEALGWEASSGHIKNVAGSLKTLEIVRYPSSGVLALEPWTLSP